MLLIILSNQLPIVGLVGRYPTNYLIGRGPISCRSKPFPLRAHPVLPPVSQGYSEAEGTFPRVTNPSAADARRHPLDLHVLSLPPAFVLSQDQTLKLNVHACTILDVQTSAHRAQARKPRRRPCSMQPPATPSPPKAEEHSQRPLKQ